MYASRMSAVGCAYYTFVGITILLLWLTWLTFRVWRVETAGVWTTGQIVGTSHCTGRDNKPLSTANLQVAFTDTTNARHISQTECQYDTVTVGQSIAIRYIPGDPGYVLTREDIGGGQGFPLIVLMILDVVCVSAVSLVAVLAIRANRRAAHVPAQQPSLAVAHGMAAATRHAWLPHPAALTNRQRRALDPHTP